MARFDVYAFNGGHVMDLQNDYVLIPGSRVVAPILPKVETYGQVKGLHPDVVLNGQHCILATHMLAATPSGAFKAVDVTLEFDQLDITRALDILFQGY